MDDRVILVRSERIAESKLEAQLDRARLPANAGGEPPQLDVLVGSGVALLLVVTTFVLPSSPSLLHAVLGFLVGLVLPGYFLVNAVFARELDLTGVERWGLILVMNVVLVIILSLLISLVHPLVSVIRLDALTVTSALSVITVLLSALLVWRRSALPPAEAYQFVLPRGRAPRLVIALTVVLGATTWFAVSRNLSQRIVEFSISSPRGQLLGYPFQVSIGSRYVLTLRVDNPTSSAVAYHLVIAATRGRHRTQAVDVGAQGHWTSQVALPSNGPPRTEAVHFSLTQGKQVVRTLWIRYRIVP